MITKCPHFPIKLTPYTQSGILSFEAALTPWVGGPLSFFLMLPI